jgi:uncharacterized membrane protein (DUF485 family)
MEIDVPNTAGCRQYVANVLDVLLFLFGGGFLVAKLTGNATRHGFHLEGWPFLALIVLFVVYVAIAKRYLGGTLFEHLFGLGRKRR